MYDRPETAVATEDYWAAIRRELRFGPERLTKTVTPWDHWRSPDLLFSQTCGLPLRLGLFHQVQLVGTPDYDLAGCEAGYYRSVVVMRRKDPRRDNIDLSTLMLACNSAESQSGWAAAYGYAERRGMQFRQALETGSHLLSARAVSEGRADIAFIDAQSWRQIARYEPWVDLIDVVDDTEAAPGLPYITGPEGNPGKIAAAVKRAIENLQEQTRSALDIAGLVQIPLETYLELPNPPPPPLRPPVRD